MMEAFAEKELLSNKKAAAVNKRATIKRDLAQIISTVRSAGVAIDDNSFIPGLRALSAPALDHQGEAAAVITLIGAEEFSPNQNVEAVRFLKEVSEERLSSPSLNLIAEHSPQSYGMYCLWAPPK